MPSWDAISRLAGCLAGIDDGSDSLDLREARRFLAKSADECLMLGADNPALAPAHPESYAL